MGKHSSRKSSNNSQSGNGKHENNYEHNMALLQEQLRNQMLSFSSSMLSYYATLEGVMLLELKHQNNDSTEGLDASLFYNPDITAIQSQLFAIIARYNFMQIGFIKYNELYQRYINGEISYSLQPNIDINISNVLAMLADFYGYRGALGIYERDLAQPVYGI